MKFQLPTLNQLVVVAISMIVITFILKAVMPESVKSLFRV